MTGTEEMGMHEMGTGRPRALPVPQAFEIPPSALRARQVSTKARRCTQVREGPMHRSVREPLVLCAALTIFGRCIGETEDASEPLNDFEFKRLRALPGLSLNGRHFLYSSFLKEAQVDPRGWRLSR